jgi:hypothetical protein
MTSLITATYIANCAILALPDSDVRKMLTLDCALAPQSVTPAGTHPVIILFGDETNVRVPWLPFIAPFQYGETILVVPWVVHASSPRAVMANPSRLWVNHFAAWLGGRIFGFPKRLARIEESASSYSVRSLFAGQPIFSPKYGVPGLPGKPSSFANYAPIEPIFKQLLLLRLFCIFPLISIDMHWEMAEATMQALAMDVEVYRGADPGIAPGSYRVESIDQQAIGGFRLTVNWRMAWPKLL